MKLPEELQFIANSLNPPQTTQARLDGKLCVITGATSGIGYETAKLLARGGAHLVMVCRDKDKAAAVQKELEGIYGVKADPVIADFQRLAEVQLAGLYIQEHYPRVDLLINNVGVFNKRRRLTPDGFEMTLGVIHLASFLLTRLLLDNMRQGAPSRVLFISSEAHRFGGFNLNDLNWRKRPFIGLWAYAAAKIAQLHTALTFAEQLKDEAVTVNVMHPGAVRSNIGMNNGFFYRIYKRFILKWFLKDPEQSAEAIYFLSADPSLEGATGKYFNLTTEEKPAWYAVRQEKRAAVWARTETLVQPFLKEL